MRLQAPEKKADEAARILKKAMIGAGRTYLSEVPVEVEVKIVESCAGK